MIRAPFWGRFKATRMNRRATCPFLPRVAPFSSHALPPALKLSPHRYVDLPSHMPIKEVSKTQKNSLLRSRDLGRRKGEERS